ncbi:hypothetical protein SeMB42_g00159 [Synchytrium endobioticum]|uniref:Aromatic-L-amino-acid decarboxylase n=1 Tax=Synchytrium endobioticum TaxID=286115 RepID=A0A507DSB8_9FUNG|nr:hypothetical protein SeMB42_g00159 [Synchytrium endobioticum]
MDADEFRKRGHEAVERIARYYDEIGKYKVLSSVAPGYLAKSLPDHAPEEPESWASIQADFESKIMPGVTHWQHPSFFAFYPANSSYPGILGDMYSSMLNCIAFNWQSSPSCTELETITLDWVAKMCNLDKSFLSSGKGGGIIQGTASEAVLIAVIAARERVLQQYRNCNASENELSSVASRLMAYGSTQTHSCTKKACRILNLKFTSIQTDETYRMRGVALKEQIEKDSNAGFIPFYLTATIGTTSSGAVDAIPELVDTLKSRGSMNEQSPIWLHVDAAYAGAAMVCPEHQHHLIGTDYADSYNFNAHKWMLVNFDCSLMYVKDRSYLTNALSLTPPYLRNAASDTGLVFDYRDWQLPLGRRFRSLKLWFVLRTYGVRGIQEHIRKHVGQAHRFHELLQSRNHIFNVVTRPHFALVLDTVNASGAMFLTPTELNANYVIRFVPGSRDTQNQHIDNAFNALLEAAQMVRERRSRSNPKL